MDQSYLLFRDFLVRSVMDAKLARVASGEAVVSTDPVRASQIAAALTVSAYRRPPVNRKGDLVLE